MSCTTLAQPPMMAARADAAELMHGAESADDDVILDHDVPGERAVVGEDDMIPDDAVVRDVDVAEEVVVAADDRFVIRRGGAVDGAELAEGVVVTHFEPGGLGLVFQILRLLADGAVGEEFVVLRPILDGPMIVT
jgi:hypothetical protein